MNGWFTMVFRGLLPFALVILELRLQDYEWQAKVTIPLENEIQFCLLDYLSNKNTLTFPNYQMAPTKSTLIQMEV